MSESFAIAHVTPYPWEVENEVNAHVARVACELSRRGHRVLVLAPSRSLERVRDSRKALRAARGGVGGSESLLEGTDNGIPRVIAVGEVLDLPGGARRRPPALAIDVARTVEELLGTIELDFVHVHEPFAPSTSNAALRHSRALNVGSFHASTERLLSTLVARRFVESFFGRLDARTASLPATAELMARHFPAEYRMVRDDGAAVDALEEIYNGLAARRHSRDGDAALRQRLAGRRTIDVDLHMHTDHSYDCATPVEVLLATAREQGLGAIAVTDHNEISGALEAREQAAGFGPHPPVKVIVGEEVKTAGQGEVIGLFIREKIPHGLSMEETVAEIRRQGDRGLQPTRGDRRVQRRGGPLRGEVPARGRRRLGLPRGSGTRLRADSHARLRRAGRVPAVAAGRGDRDPSFFAVVRAGVEVPADARHAPIGAEGQQGAASEAPRTRPWWRWAAVRTPAHPRKS